MARARTTAGRVAAWSVGARETHQSVDVGFRLAARDQHVAAGVLAGGVAYRLFFWLISVSVLATGAFGMVHNSWLEETLGVMGASPAVSDVVTDLAGESEQSRWWILLVGGWLVLWTGYLGAKALVLVHAAVWGVPAPRTLRPWALSLLFTGTVTALAASIALAAWLHTESGVRAVVADVASTALPFAMWLAVSLRLPHRGTGWRGLVPGALLVAFGIQAFSLFTTWFLVPKLANATQIYGLVGIVSTLLFWLYVLGRLAIGAATLNASLHEHRSAAKEPDQRPE